MTQEVQHAEVTLRVALPVDKEASEEQRLSAIMRKLRLEMGDGIELHPPLRPKNGTLTRTETMDEYAIRLEGEAEARAEAKLDRQRERYFDEHGHF